MGAARNTVFEVVEPFRVYADAGYTANGITHITRKGSLATHVEIVREAINARPGDILFTGGGTSYLVRPDGTQRRISLRPPGHWDGHVEYLSDRRILARSQRVRPSESRKYPDTAAVNAAVERRRFPPMHKRLVETEESPEMTRFRRHALPILDAVRDLRDRGVVDRAGNPPSRWFVDHRGNARVSLRLSFDAYRPGALGDGSEVRATVFQLDWEFSRGQAVVYAHLGAALPGREPTEGDPRAGRAVYRMRLSEAVQALPDAVLAYVAERAAAPEPADPAPRCG